MTDDLRARIRTLEAELAALKADFDEAPRATSRRGLLRAAAAAGAAGVVGAAALGRPAAAATGGNLVLGQANTADAVTSLANNGPFPDLAGPAPVALELRSPGAHVRFVGAPGDTLLGTFGDGELAYNGTTGLWLDTNSDRVRVGAAGYGPLQILPQPVRLYDSRNPAPDGDGRLASGQSVNRNIDIGQHGEQLQLDAVFLHGVMVNVTVVDTVGSGFLSVGNPGLTGKPTTSNINWSASGQTLANLALATLFEGNLSVFAGGGGSTHVVIDLVAFVG